MMTDKSYPTSLAEIDSWSRENGVPTQDARIRFMEFVILNCIAANAVTRQNLVLKGGNALRFAYQSPRSTKDLDFSVAAGGIPDEEDRMRDLLTAALTFAYRRFGVKAKCQRVKRNPKNPDATRPTYNVGIGYQFPTDRYFHNFESRNYSQVIPLEITLNDLVCDTAEWAEIPELRVCSLEDILAEKLRALLQQKPCNRNRPQDVYDICMCMRRSEIDRRKIAEFFMSKSSIRAIEPQKSSFDEEIRERACVGYDVHITTQAPRDFIPFEEAWRAVRSLVQSLDIPD